MSLARMTSQMPKNALLFMELVNDNKYKTN